MEVNYWKDRYYDSMKQCKELREKNNQLTEALTQAIEEVSFYKERVKSLESELSLFNNDLPILSLNSIPGPSETVMRSISSKYLTPKSATEDSIFEQFLIIGSAETRDVSTEKSHTPKILFKYPKESSFNAGILADFAFPEGLRAEVVDCSRSGTALYSLVYASYERDHRSFIFTIKAQEAQSKSYQDFANNDKEVLYCCCFVTYEISDRDVDEQTPCPLLPRCYCIVSFYPCFELHFEVIFKLLQIKRIQRINSFSPDTTRDSPQTIRRLASFSEIDSDEQDLLSSYRAHKGLKPGLVSIAVPGMPDIKMELNRLEMLDYEWVCPALFSLLEFQDFFQLLCALAHEKSVIFVSDNLDHITSCVLALSGLLRPFKWPHLICPILPEALKDVLEAPVPLIGGVMKTESMNEDTIYVMTETGRVHHCCQIEPSRHFKNELRDLYESFKESHSEGLDDMKMDALYSIVTRLRAFWMGFVSRIPPPSDMNDMDNIDFELIKTSILSEVEAEDVAFTELLVESQLFLNAVEAIYKNN